MVQEKFTEWFNDLSDAEKVEVWNIYARENDCDNEIFENDEEFFEMFFTKAIDAVRAVSFGNYNYSHRYVWFNGYANLDSSDWCPDWVNPEECFEYFEENPNELDYIESELFEDEETEEEDTED